MLMKTTVTLSNDLKNKKLFKLRGNTCGKHTFNPYTLETRGTWISVSLRTPFGSQSLRAA